MNNPWGQSNHNYIQTGGKPSYYAPGNPYTTPVQQYQQTYSSIPNTTSYIQPGLQNQYGPQAQYSPRHFQYGQQTQQQFHPFSGAPVDFQVDRQVDNLFAKYDLDRSGGLNKQEMIPAANELFRNMNLNKTISATDAQQLIYMMDTNKNMTVEKHEFAAAIKKILQTWK